MPYKKHPQIIHLLGWSMWNCCVQSGYMNPPFFPGCVSLYSSAVSLTPKVTLSPNSPQTSSPSLLTWIIFIALPFIWIVVIVIDRVISVEVCRRLVEPRSFALLQRTPSRLVLRSFSGCLVLTLLEFFAKVPAPQLVNRILTWLPEKQGIEKAHRFYDAAEGIVLDSRHK